MNNIKNMVNTKKDSLNLLENEKLQLQNNMANPSHINNNAQEIETEKRGISLLQDAMELAKESGTDNSSAKEILENLVGELVEAKSEAEDMIDEGYIAETSRVLSTLIEDLDIIKNIIDQI